MKHLYKPLLILCMSILLIPVMAQDAEVTPVVEDIVPETTPAVIPEGGFEVGNDLTFESLLALEIEGSEITFEQQLANGNNYSQYIASYVSEGNKIFGLLTVPFGIAP
ncbi:MAG: hypothetical protein ACPG7F_21505, partial [Aggregatilineales bacterium]